MTEFLKQQISKLCKTTINVIVFFTLFVNLKRIIEFIYNCILKLLDTFYMFPIVLILICVLLVLYVLGLAFIYLFLLIQVAIINNKV